MRQSVMQKTDVELTVATLNGNFAQLAVICAARSISRFWAHCRPSLRSGRMTAKRTKLPFDVAVLMAASWRAKQARLTDYSLQGDQPDFAKAVITIQGLGPSKINRFVAQSYFRKVERAGPTMG